MFEAFVVSVFATLPSPIPALVTVPPPAPLKTPADEILIPEFKIPLGAPTKSALTWALLLRLPSPIPALDTCPLPAPDNVPLAFIVIPAFIKPHGARPI